MDKTALRQLKDWVDKELKLEGYEHKTILSKIEELLPAEQMHIKQAYENGALDAEASDLGWNRLYKSATDYFTKTYKE